MNIISSNKLENLVLDLAENIANSKKSFAQKDKVIVQSPAMAKWLNLEIAENNGISAQISFPLLKTFIVRSLAAMGFCADNDLWSRETLAWRIFKILPHFEQQASAKVLLDYCRQDNDRRLQLAAQIAGLFDEYMLYRQDWLVAWERNEVIAELIDEEHQAWQADLWRALMIEACPSFHQALIDFNHCTEADTQRLRLPTTLSLFGISNMPPVFIHFFNKLSALCPETQINMYYLSPCEEYWSDLQVKGLRFDRSSQEEDSPFDQQEQMPRPYELLKSWGLLGRDFLNTLVDHCDIGSADLYQAHEKPSLLNSVQNAILNLDETTEQLENDASIVINSCHNPLRELQVLHDHIRSLMIDDPELQARDILVLCPDISSYAPYIKAVFDENDFNENTAPKDENGRFVDRYKIPYSVSDRALCASSPMVNTFLKILALPKGRLNNNELLDILESSELLQQFSLTLDDLGTLRQWIEDSGIRWGENAEARESLLGIKGFSQNSWDFGLDRLMNGYAFDDEDLYHGSLAHPVQSDGLLLGRFKTLLDRLFQLRRDLQQAYLPSDWSTLLQSIVEQFFVDSYETAAERAILTQAISNIAEQWELAEIDDLLSSDLVLKNLSNSLQGQSSSHGFMDKGITFCALLPMRCIPAKVICVLGLNEGQFPRLDQRSGFDLTVPSWRQGDRSTRLDDRYIFLETFLAARQHFYLSYRGISEKDNSPIPPSIILSEFLDFLKNNLGDFPVQQHPLQAYSDKYFSQDLKSYSYKNYLSAEASHQALTEDKKFCPETLGLPESLKGKNPIPIELEDLISFYRNPTKSFLKKQLNTSLWLDEVSELPEDEAFDDPNNLEKYELKTRIYQALESVIQDLGDSQDLENALNQQEESILRPIMARGELPYAAKGEKFLKTLFTECRDFIIKVHSAKSGQEEKTQQISLFLPQSAVQLTGQVAQLYDDEYQAYRLGKEGTKYCFLESLSFLALSAQSDEESYKLRYNSFDKCSVSNTAKPAWALESLDLLCSTYLQGLGQSLACSSELFAAYQDKCKGKDPEKDKVAARKALRTTWEESSFSGASALYQREENKICFNKNFFEEDSPERELHYSLFEQFSEIYKELNWRKEA